MTKCVTSHKNIQHLFSTYYDINDHFLGQQNSILEWFLEDHVIRKTGVMMLNFSFAFIGIYYILKYFPTETNNIEYFT